MKKLVILVLVLGMVSMAMAVPVFEFRDAAGTTVITELNSTVATSFQFAIRDTYTASSGTYQMYDPYENVAVGHDVADMTGAALGSAAGAFGALPAYDSLYDGYVLNWGDTGTQSGDIVVIDITLLPGVTIDTYTIGSYTGYTTLLTSYSLGIVPEPMTIALLGLGGLFLRRRK